MRDRPLDGQLALVTGAGSPDGIGFACSTALGALGAGLVLVSTTDRIHERARELCDIGISAEGEAGDLSDAGFVGRMIDRIAAHYGRLDICVNNAGMATLGRSMPPPRFTPCDRKAGTPGSDATSPQPSLSSALSCR